MLFRWVISKGNYLRMIVRSMGLAFHLRDSRKVSYHRWWLCISKFYSCRIEMRTLHSLCRHLDCSGRFHPWMSTYPGANDSCLLKLVHLKDYILLWNSFVLNGHQNKWCLLKKMQWPQFPLDEWLCEEWRSWFFLSCLIFIIILLLVVIFKLFLWRWYLLLDEIVLVRLIAYERSSHEC